MFKSIRWFSMVNQNLLLNCRKNEGVMFRGNLSDSEEIEECTASTRNGTVDSYPVEERPRYTLSSVFPNLEVQNQVMEILRKDREERIECHKKARFSSYLNVPSEEIGQWSWDKIDEHILEQVNSPKGIQKFLCKVKRKK